MMILILFIVIDASTSIVLSPIIFLFLFGIILFGIRYYLFENVNQLFLCMFILFVLYYLLHCICNVRSVLWLNNNFREMG